MKYKIKYASPEWKDIPEAKSSYDYEQYMINKHGFTRKSLIGGIGHGTKTHKFSTVCKIEKDVIYIADYMSFCGSAKFSSALYLYDDQDIPCTCKKCNR